MSKLNQRGIAHFLVPLLLLGGIIVTVYLITAGPLKLFSRAASAPTSWPPISDRIEIVDDKGNPITTTNTTKVKLKVTWVDDIIIQENGGGGDISAPTGRITASAVTIPDGQTNGFTRITVDQLQNFGSNALVCVVSNAPNASLVTFASPGSASTPWSGNTAASYDGTAGAWIAPGVRYTFNLYNWNSSTAVHSDCAGTPIASVVVDGPSSTPPFPQSFRVANSYEDLAQAPEYAFTGNPTTIDWDITEGLYFIPEQGPYGQRTVYAQFKLGEFWGGTVHASIELTESETQECTINQFAETFGSSTDDYRYIKNCDVNYDGKINIYDIFDLLRNRPHI